MIILTGSGPEQTGVTILARIYGTTGILITQASITSIAYTVTDLLAGTTSAGTLTVASVVFNQAMTNDPRWTFDTVGFNFLATLPATAFPLTTPAANVYGNPPTPNVYQIDIAFTPVSGQAFRVSGKYTAGATFG